MKKWLIPLIALVGVLAAITLVVAPILKATPRNIPIALLNLDQTPSVQGGTQNLGETAMQVFTSTGTPTAGSSGSQPVFNFPVKWTICNDQACIDSALSSNSVYATIVIPADFTSTLTAAQSDSTVTPSQIAVTINQGKNPTVAAMVAQMMAAASQQFQLTFTSSYVNQIPTDEGNGMVATLVAVLMMFASLITTIVLTTVVRVDYTRKAGRAKAILQQVGMAAGLAAVTALVAPPILGGLTGAKLPYWNLVVLIFLGFFAFATIVLFSVDWLGMRGLVIPALVLILGLPVLAVPYELLMSFWQHAVYPWVPQRFMVEGSRGVLFLGQHAGNSSTLWLAATAIVGLAILFASLARPVVQVDAVQPVRSNKSGNPALNPTKRRH